MLLLLGTVAVLARSGVFANGKGRLAGDDMPACPGSVNLWADQRLRMLRAQLEQDHGLYRRQGQAMNAIGAAMIWIDDRIIDQRIGEERQQIRSTVLQSTRCLVQFHP